MPQIHREQFGLFHVTTTTQDKIPWCITAGVPEHLIHCLALARNIYGAKIHAFSILPNHLHLILSPGIKGLSKFMQAFKSRSIKGLQKPLHGLIERRSWQAGFYDERIRNENQLSAAMAYVQGNGMKHGFAREIMDWPWTSLHFPTTVDPLDFWW